MESSVQRMRQKIEKEALEMGTIHAISMGGELHHRYSRRKARGFDAHWKTMDE